MEDTREALGTLSEKFKKQFIRIYSSKTETTLLHPTKPEDPKNIPLILHRPKTKKNPAITINIDNNNSNGRDMDGNTLLHLAVIHYNPKQGDNQLGIIKAIRNSINKINVNVHNEQFLTPLDIAAAQVPIDLDLIEILLSPGPQNVDVWTTLENRQMLLREAITHNRPRLVAYLLRNDANPRTADESGKTALHYAFEELEPNEEIIQLLEENMKDRYSHLKSMNGANLLHIVAHEGIEGLTKDLVHYYDVNSRTQQGATPLAFAINKPSIIKELIKAGARPWNWTAYQLRKPSQKEMRGVNKLLKELQKENAAFELKLEDKPAGIQSAMFNLLAYTGKLKSELDDPKFYTRTRHLQQKYDALKTLIKDLLSENDPELMKTKLSAALRNDSLIENRSKIVGFYFLHGIFSKKRNLEDQNAPHYVKSATEELLYDLKAAIENSERNVESTASKKQF